LVGFNVDASVASGDLVHGQAADAHLKLELRFLDTGVVRARVTEKVPLHGGRWEAKDLLLPEAQAVGNLLQPKVLGGGDAGYPNDISSDDASTVTVLSAKAGVVLAVYHSPFSLALYVDGELRATANSDGKFHFERHHTKEGAGAKQVSANAAADAKEEKEIVDYGEDGLAIYADGSKEVREVEDDDDDVVSSDGDGAWEENFGSHKDSKPYGPASIRMDIAFPSSRSIFGIPEHATSFALKDTTGPNAYYHEPFRLYNLDVFEFDLDSQMALYGGIPTLFGLTPGGDATAALWLNPSETFVDIETDAQGGKKSVWISESGVVDLLFMPGPTLDDIFRQQSKLTGVTPIPPLFSLAYHQCRWNYKDEADVAQVCK
jgi:alpha 1,3-glucosidase